MTKYYSQAPIKEAIIDLKVLLPTDFAVETFLNIHDAIHNDFPTIQPIHTSSLVLQAGTDIQLGPDVQIGTNQQHSGFLFKSKDNLQIIQATLQGFTFNQLAPYESWEKFSGTARSLWQIYRNVCKPSFLVRAAIRYINQFNIPATESIDLKDYFKTIPEIALDLPQKNLNSFFMQLQIPQDDLSCMLILNENLVPPPTPGFLSIIFDIDLFRQSVWKSEDESLWDFLNQLRDRKNQIFTASITNKTEELIK